MLKVTGVRVVAICDIDPATLKAAIDQATAAGQSPDAYREYRKVLDRKDIDAVGRRAGVHKAIAAGGKHAMDPMDHGFMYGELLRRRRSPPGGHLDGSRGSLIINGGNFIQEITLQVRLAQGQVWSVQADRVRSLRPMMQDKDPERSRRVMKAMLQMTKLDVHRLKQACDDSPSPK